MDMSQQALEGPSKLHGLRWSKAEGLRIDAKEGVVRDSAGPAVTLGDDTQRRQAEIRVVNQEVGWKESPVSLLNHANILLAEKVDVFGG